MADPIISTIPCPDCESSITFDTLGLLRGEKVQCSGCGSILSIAEENSETLRATLAEFDKLKQDALKAK